MSPHHWLLFVSNVFFLSDEQLPPRVWPLWWLGIRKNPTPPFQQLIPSRWTMYQKDPNLLDTLIQEQPKIGGGHFKTNVSIQAQVTFKKYSLGAKPDKKRKEIYPVVNNQRIILFKRIYLSVRYHRRLLTLKLRWTSITGPPHILLR